MTDTVLVIDDSLTYREELRRIFEEAGYGVEVARTGEEGLQMAAERPPHAIVVDGLLPGVDGPTVIRRIRLDVALRATPCLLLTASDDAGAELRALDAGADAFVRKEEDAEVVLARLRAMLRRSIPRDDPRASRKRRIILSVDDDVAYAETLGASLELDGFEVVFVETAEAALDQLAVKPIDCILLDVVMPGMGGHEACRRIKAAPVVRDIPLLMLTARDDRQSMLDGLAAGADDFVQKTGDTDVLRARVRSLIRRKLFEEENRHMREELLRKEREASETRAARELAETRAGLAEELERKNAELEAFSYSVSHDLRAPLRAIDGFSQALVEEHHHQLDDEGRDYLRRVRAAASRMGDLIDDLLELSRVGRADIAKTTVDMSAISGSIVERLRSDHPQRHVEVVIEPLLIALGDAGLLRAALENLIGNAWKFTSKRQTASITIGARRSAEGAGIDRVVYFVKDDGAGFNMSYQRRLFKPFQRLHHVNDFEGTGVGLATVQRIVERHGGRIWAEGKPDEGATFFFTIPSGRAKSP